MLKTLRGDAILLQTSCVTNKHFIASRLHNCYLYYFSEFRKKINIPTVSMCQSVAQIPSTKSLKFPSTESPLLGIPYSTASHSQYVRLYT